MWESHALRTNIYLTNWVEGLEKNCHLYMSRRWSSRDFTMQYIFILKKWKAKKVLFGLDLTGCPLRSKGSCLILSNWKLEIPSKEFGKTFILTYCLSRWRCLVLWYRKSVCTVQISVVVLVCCLQHMHLFLYCGYIYIYMASHMILKPWSLYPLRRILFRFSLL